MLKIDCYTSGSQDRFLYGYKTKEPFWIVGLLPIIRKLSDGGDKKIDGTKAVRPIYRDQFATRHMSFKILKVALVQELKKITEFLGILSFETQGS